jgi:hypothetical protein
MPIRLTMLLAAAAAAGLALAAAPVPRPQVFEEVDGRIIMEVESYPPQGDWKPEKDLEGFSGQGYYTWRGADLFKSGGQGALLYAFRVKEDGKFHLRIHNRHDFEDSTEQNDCWTRLDDGKWTKTFSPKRGEWTWTTNHEHDHATKPPASYELKAGPHVLAVSGRSKGFSIDRIHLYRDGAKDPTDLKAPETRAADDAKPDSPKPDAPPRPRAPYPVPPR